MPRNRHAFTLIEVIVVLAILGVLMGLLLPAIQKAREAGSRVACLSNLRQIGIAFHTHHDQKRCLPPGRTSTPFRHGWAAHLLPFLDAGDIAQQYDWNSHWSSVANRSARAAWL